MRDGVPDLPRGLHLGMSLLNRTYSQVGKSRGICIRNTAGYPIEDFNERVTAIYVMSDIRYVYSSVRGQHSDMGSEIFASEVCHRTWTLMHSSHPPRPLWDSLCPRLQL